METQNKQIAPYENYKKIMAYGQSPEVLKAFRDVLGSQAPVYIQSAINAVRMDERLQECTPRSIFNAALRAATMRLSCDPAVGQAYLIPYRNKGVMEAQFQAGWKGIQHMALRTGKYQYINVSKVYDGEEVEEDRITGELKITGQMKSPKRDIGLIASFGLINGYRKSIYMSYEELEEHGKRYSKSYQSGRQDSIWLTNKQLAYHKTILLKLLRTYGYLEPADAALLDAEEDEIVNTELPPEDKVTIIEMPKYGSIAEINKSLGYEEDDSGENSGIPIKRPYKPEELQQALQGRAKTCPPASEAQAKLLIRKMQELVPDADYRHLVNKFLFGAEHISEADPKMIVAGIRWLNLDDQYQADPLSEQELKAVIDLVSGVDLIEPIDFGELED